MASKTALYWYELVPDGAGGLKVQSSGSAGYTIYDDGVDETFFPSEPVIIEFSPGNSYSTTYLGTFEGGVVVPIGNTYLLTDVGPDAYPRNTVIPYTSSALTVCFMAGTMIACPNGDRAVETLANGDMVLTVDGAAHVVRWVGRQTVVSVFADPHRSFPVLIEAGAIGDNLPARDLYVSPDHALFVDGLLIHAAALVNGTTIRRMENPPERFTYYHVELANQELILAEGVPAETFVDNVTRQRFDNYQEFVGLLGGNPPIEELGLPRVKSVRQLPRQIRERLAARAAAMRASRTLAA